MLPVVYAGMLPVAYPGGADARTGIGQPYPDDFIAIARRSREISAMRCGRSFGRFAMQRKRRASSMGST